MSKTQRAEVARVREELRLLKGQLGDDGMGGDAQGVMLQRLVREKEEELRRVRVGSEQGQAKERNAIDQLRVRVEGHQQRLVEREEEIGGMKLAVGDKARQRLRGLLKTVFQQKSKGQELKDIAKTTEELHREAGVLEETLNRLRLRRDRDRGDHHHPAVGQQIQMIGHRQQINYQDHADAMYVLRAERDILVNEAAAAAAVMDDDDGRLQQHGRLQQLQQSVESRRRFLMRLQGELKDIDGEKEFRGETEEAAGDDDDGITTTLLSSLRQDVEALKKNIQNAETEAATSIIKEEEEQTDKKIENRFGATAAAAAAAVAGDESRKPTTKSRSGTRRHDVVTTDLIDIQTDIAAAAAELMSWKRLSIKDAGGMTATALGTDERTALSVDNVDMEQQQGTTFFVHPTAAGTSRLSESSPRSRHRHGTIIDDNTSMVHTSPPLPTSSLTPRESKSGGRGGEEEAKLHVLMEYLDRVLKFQKDYVIPTLTLQAASKESAVCSEEINEQKYEGRDDDDEEQEVDMLFEREVLAEYARAEDRWQTEMKDLYSVSAVASLGQLHLQQTQPHQQVQQQHSTTTAQAGPAEAERAEEAALVVGAAATTARRNLTPTRYHLVKQQQQQHRHRSSEPRSSPSRRLHFNHSGGTGVGTQRQIRRSDHHAISAAGAASSMVPATASASASAATGTAPLSIPHKKNNAVEKKSRHATNLLENLRSRRRQLLQKQKDQDEVDRRFHAHAQTESTTSSISSSSSFLSPSRTPLGSLSTDHLSSVGRADRQAHQLSAASAHHHHQVIALNSDSKSRSSPSPRGRLSVSTTSVPRAVSMSSSPLIYRQDEEQPGGHTELTLEF